MLTSRKNCAIMRTQTPELSKTVRVYGEFSRFLKLIGKYYNLSGKCLKKRRNFCIIKFGRGKPLSLLPLFAFESEVIYVKHY